MQVLDVLGVVVEDLVLTGHLGQGVVVNQGTGLPTTGATEDGPVTVVPHPFLTPLTHQNTHTGMITQRPGPLGEARPGLYGATNSVARRTGTENSVGERRQEMQHMTTFTNLSIYTLFDGDERHTQPPFTTSATVYEVVS